VSRAAAPRRARRFRRIWLPLVVLLVLIVGGVLLARQAYTSGLRPVNNNPQTQIFTVKPSSSVKQIAANLRSVHLIRSSRSFELYVRNKKLSSKLQAGTFAIAPNQSVPQIVVTLTGGQATNNLVTILPGRRIDQVRADLINDGFTPTDVDNALNPGHYADVPILGYKPATISSLEGLLWPDSFQRDPTISAAYIIRESLVEMSQHLTPDVQTAFAAEGLTPYQGLTLASIVVQEVNKPADQAQAAQVFLTRLKSGSSLGSDVTARYGAIAAGQVPSLSYDSPYNTLIHQGLPPTPISSISQSALDAAAHPANTNWLYFVTGDDGTTYFSTNLQEHQALTQKYCHRLCGQ